MSEASATNILVDLDGTLTDPREGIAACIRYALGCLGFPAPDDARMAPFIGPPLRESLKTLMPGADNAMIDRALALYRTQFVTDGMFRNSVYPGIAAALAALREEGARLFVATSKPRIFAERILEHFGLHREFSAVHGSELDGTRSHKAELIAHVLHSEKLAAADTVMVGDRSHDIRAACDNGLRSIGALWGYGSREELVAAGASLLCERPHDLPIIIARAARG